MRELTKLKEGVYWNGNSVIYPIKKNQEEPFKKGNIDWKNFIMGNKGTLIVMILVLMLAFAYSHDTQACRELMEQPCIICDSMRSAAVDVGCSLENQKMGLCFNLDGLGEIDMDFKGVIR